MHGQHLGPVPRYPTTTQFPSRVPMQLQPVHVYCMMLLIMIKNGIQVSPHILPGFDAYEDGRELPSLDE
jgi:hypothetical protein